MSSAADLLKVAETDVASEIPRMQYGTILTNPPFVDIDGTFNTRDLGQIPNSPIRSNFAFRSGALGRLTHVGVNVLTLRLDVKRVFDLRSPEERDKMPDPVIEGVENTWIQSTRPESHPDLDHFVAGEGEEGYREMYLEVIDVYQDSWKAILEHVRDRPEDAFLVHCTAGRDRTGVFAGLLMKIAGASDDVIVLDWLLSRIGTEPVRQKLLQFAMEGTFAKSTDQPGFHNLCNLRASCWKAFVDGVQEEYGGFDKFITEKLGFSTEDVAKIRRNLTSFE
ncbi:protein-tyrosine phosphatase-like protein [Xylariomycetidae sp. FL2044]|nr:protein-tyrosine phosphatase-like protein [Xylariomycetidae sp. FL2044]